MTSPLSLSLRTFLAVALLTMPFGATAQLTNDPPPDAKRYVLFIHSGSSKGVDVNIANKIAQTLAQRGYIVRPPEKDSDEVGGPGVDYFRSADLPGARDITAVVNQLLPKGLKQLEPRIQRVTNQPGYIGVWLFE